MSRYDVFGVGNALVDVEYEVTPQQLTELSIDKGVMTLVDAPQQQRIVAGLGTHESHRGSGGSAANTIIAVSQLGGKSFYCCRVANDSFGQFYLEDLTRAGVATNRETRHLEEGTTGTCLVLITPDADRTMNTFLGVSADLSPDDVDAEAIAQSQFIYVEGYLATGPSSRAAALHAVQRARQFGIKVAFSLSDPNIVHFFRPAIDELIGEGVDLLFANEDEAKRMGGTDSLEEAIQHLKTIAREFVVTRGADGAVVYDGTSLHAIAPEPTQAVDTVGAGDMFAGAFLFGITQGMSHTQAGALASLAASRIVSSLGPRLSLEQMQQLLNDFRARQA